MILRLSLTTFFALLLVFTSGAASLPAGSEAVPSPDADKVLITKIKKPGQNAQDLSLQKRFSFSIAPMPARDLESWDEYVAAYRLAKELGFDIAHSYMQWGDIEQRKGRFNWQAVQYYVILSRQQAMQLSMEITVINVNSLGKFPADLDGKPLTSPEVQQRFLAFIDAFSRRYADDISYLWLGNEIDTYLAAHAKEIPAWTELFRKAVAVVHRNAPKMQVGTVLTYHDAVKNQRTDWIDKWGPIADVIGVTFYPEMMPGGFKPNQIQAQFDALVKDYGAYPLALVETAVGAVTDFGGGEEAQRLYCQELLTALDRHRSHFVFGGWFNLHDYAPAYLRHLRSLFGGDTPLTRWFGSTGLASFAGKKRPVLEEWRQRVQNFRAQEEAARKAAQRTSTSTPAKQ